MDQKLRLKEKEIPVCGEYDVIVAGGGTAGSIAAISACKMGLSVLVIEESGTLGGTSTRGLVSPIMPNLIKDFPIEKINAMSEIRGEIVSRLEESGEWKRCGYGVDFNPIAMSVALEEMSEKYGAEILYHTTLVDVIVEERRVTHVVIYNKGGLSAIRGKMFIDCTGDADLCVMAGVPVFSGNSQGVNQNISLRFEMAQVDIPKYDEFMDKLRASKGGVRAFLKRKYEEGYIREEDSVHFQTFAVLGKPNCIAFNCPELGRTVNVIDPAFMSKQQIEGKRAVLRLARFCKECIPGFENAFITQISPILGIRDSRRIFAEYMLTCDDVHAYRKFKDGIAPSNYPLDAHGEKDYGIGAGVYDTEVSENERYYEIPLRSLIPVGVDNVMCAGRCAGTDFLAQSTTRIQHSCHYMGEAAGIACAFAIKDNIAMRDVDGALVRAVMAKRGDPLLAKTW